MIEKFLVEHVSGKAFIKYDSKKEMITIGGNKKFEPIFQLIASVFGIPKPTFIDNQKNKIICIYKLNTISFTKSIFKLKAKKYITCIEINKLGRELN